MAKSSFTGSFRAKSKNDYIEWAAAADGKWRKVYSRSRDGVPAPPDQKCWAGKCGKFDQAAFIAQLLKSFDKPEEI